MLLAMPFPASKCQKRKAYYKQHEGHEKALTKKYYDANRDTIIDRVLERGQVVTSINPKKSNADTRHRVAKHCLDYSDIAKAKTRQHVAMYREHNPDNASTSRRQSMFKQRLANPTKARADRRESMAKYRLANPTKARADSCMSMRKSRLSVESAKRRAQNRWWVSAHYHRDLEKSKALSRTSTAKHYIKQLKANRSKSRHTSKVWYKKFSKVIKMRRRNPLAEPNPQVVNHLMTDLQDTFCKSKSIVKKILKGVRELPAWKVKGGKSQKHSACKYASSHLVRVCLQNRRQAAAIILRIKQEIMDTTLDGIIETLVIVVTLCPGNPFLMRQATHMITCPSLHTPTACLL